jgi:carbon monoxide dehydrogenase subunit G
MIRVTRSRQIAADPSTVFATLTDHTQLASLLPRVRRVDVLEQTENSARVATHMAFGPFGDLRNEGDVRWQENREIVFSSRKPVTVESRWTLAPVGNGTEVTVQLELDLAPLIGPLAAFVPPEQVINMVGPDLEAALNALDQRLQAHAT